MVLFQTRWFIIDTFFFSFASISADLGFIPGVDENRQKEFAELVGLREKGTMYLERNSRVVEKLRLHYA